MSNILEIKNLNKKFNEFTLKNVSFSLTKGYIMGFIGPNGAGKTTTIKAILQIITPDSGSIEVFGKNALAKNYALKDDIGVVMDLPFFSEDWKVKDVEKAISPFYANWDHIQYENYSKRFELNFNKKVKELSRGMKVKLMLAVALSHHAKLLILDEPTSGLDPVARDELMNILLDFIIDENNSVLFSTHITSDLEKIADYITFIRNGEIEFTGEKDVLMDSFAIIKGDISSLTLDEKKLIIGYYEHSVGFQGMIRTENIKKISHNVYIEKITLDEIIVYMNKEGIKNE